MFKKNDLVVYENSGVCKVTDITEMSFPQSGRRLFYVLSPLFLKEGTIYTPVDNPKVTIRPVISKEEALRIIRSIPKTQVTSFEGLRTTELEGRYREASRSNKCDDLIRLAMAIYRKARRARRSGKKVSEIDDRYLKRLNTLIFGELSVALDVPEEDVSKIIENEIAKVKEA